MGYLPAPTFTPNQTVSAANWNTYVRDNIKAVAQGAMIVSGSAIVAPAGVLPLPSVLYDSSDVMTATANRLTIKQAGTYHVVVELGALAGSGATVTLRKNGATTLIQKSPPVSFEQIMDWSFPLAVSDYLEIVMSAAGGVTNAGQLTRRLTGINAILSAEWVSA